MQMEGLIEKVKYVRFRLRFIQNSELAHYCIRLKT